MTGVDVEHTKAELSESRRQMEYERFMRLQVNPSAAWKLLATSESLVAAVERVQALHEPLKLFLLDDNGSVDYSKPFDTLCRGCTDIDIVNAWECDDGDPGDDYVQHPCPTIRALEMS